MKPFRSKREKLGASNWRIQFLRGGLRPVGVTSVACVRASLLHSVRESPREDAILPLVTRHGALGGARGAEVQSVVPFGAQVLRPSESGSTLSNTVESRARCASPSRARFVRRSGGGRNRPAPFQLGLLARVWGTAIDAHRPVATTFGISRDPS